MSSHYLVLRMLGPSGPVIDGPLIFAQAIEAPDTRVRVLESPALPFRVADAPDTRTRVFNVPTP